MRSIFSEAYISNRGGRDYNEDYTLSYSNGDAYCWVVADGLGGHGGGEEASRIACETVVRSFQANPAVLPDAVQAHLRNADDALRREQQAKPALARMRSTIVVLVANAVQAVVGHVGDSRLYHFRDGRLVGQTKDHSVPQSLVDAGELAPAAIRHHEDRSRLLRALGEEQPARASVSSPPLAIGKGDIFLLTTDGFWENVLEVEMELDLAKSRNAADWLARMENRLQERVDGSHDNYTAVAVWGDALSVRQIQPLAHTGAVKRPAAVRNESSILLKLIVFLILPVFILALACFVMPERWKHPVHKHRDSSDRSQTLRPGPRGLSA
ncbi:MAG TPA: PP2C family serine/threonine-protein phosphatase [Terracidiphilus sp.]|nr:PP2C family serine/threonine-protein phosphatase [Terracidiphilus sp.]